MSNRPTADALTAACLVAALFIAPGLAGCAKEPGTAEARTPGGAAKGAQRGPSLVLAATDVANAAQGPIDAGIALTGNLQPIEEVTVRARIEGNLDDVLVREGQHVQNGQLLARFDAADMESAQRSAEADLAAARSALETARWNAQQSTELFKAGAISEQADRAAQQELVAAQARVAAAESSLRASSTTLRDTRVVSPTNGIVGQRMVEGGEHVARGAELFTVVRNDQLELAANVPARDASAVAVGQPVHFVANGENLTGRVARVSPTIDPASRSLTVYVQVPNPGGRLKGNTFATGRVIGRTIPDAVLVPSPAVHQPSEEGGSPYVFRVTDGMLERVTVAVGVVDDTRGITQILSGLAAGDQVVTGNVGAVGAGVHVQIIGEADGPVAKGGGK